MIASIVQGEDVDMAAPYLALRCWVQRAGEAPVTEGGWISGMESKFTSDLKARRTKGRTSLYMLSLEACFMATKLTIISGRGGENQVKVQCSDMHCCHRTSDATQVSVGGLFDTSLLAAPGSPDRV